MDLKVQLLQEKEKLKAKSQGIIIPSKKSNQKPNSNPGVEQRNLKDLSSDPTQNLQQNLEAKAKIYENLLNDERVHKKAKKFLVDFEQKQWDLQEKYENACQEYQGEKFEQNNVRPELGKKQKEQEEERIKWENEQKTKNTDENKGNNQNCEIQKINIVKQSYDHVLTQNEKIHIPEIEKEREKQKELQEMVRKRREEEKNLRMQKIAELQLKRKKIE